MNDALYRSIQDMEGAFLSTYCFMEAFWMSVYEAHVVVIYMLLMALHAKHTYTFTNYSHPFITRSKAHLHLCKSATYLSIVRCNLHVFCDYIHNMRWAPIRILGI